MQTVQKTLQVSVTKTANFNSADVDVPVRAGTAYLDVSAHAGTTPTLDVTIEEKDEVSGNYVQIAAFAQVLEVDTTTKVAVPLIQASKLRAVAVIAGAGGESYTYSVGFSGKEGDEA